MSSRRQPISYREPEGRQNEYFLPAEGISREVIQADICRYLGNDALVRRGVLEVWLPCLIGTLPFAELTTESAGT